MTMKHKLLLLLSLLSLPAMAAAPMIWESGDYGKMLVKKGFSFYDNKKFLTLSSDPSAGGGEVAPVGSLAIRDNGGVGEAWTKFGAGNTQWAKFLTGATTWTLLGNSATNPLTDYIGTSDAQDLVIRTNALERGRVGSAGGFTFDSVTTPIASVVQTSDVLGLKVKKVAGQTANLQEWQSDLGVVYGSVTPAGVLNFPLITGNLTGNASGTAANVTGTVAIANGGTGQTTKATAYDSLSPMSALGDTVYGGAAGTGTRLAGNTTIIKKHLAQTGDGVNSAAPEWNQILGTANQVTVTEGAGTTTLATPQDIHTAATPTFGDITITGLSGNIIGSGASVESAIEALDESATATTNTGVDSWGGAGAYYSLDGVSPNVTLTVLRPGTGYIKGKKVTWTAPQTTAIFTDNTTSAVYIDSNGLIQTSTTHSGALYRDNIMLFQVLDDGTNHVAVKEDHPYWMNTAASRYLHNNVGIIIRGSGAIPTISGTVPRVTISGSAVLEDHGLETDITGAVDVTWNIYYKNGAGNWVRDSQQQALPMKFVAAYQAGGVATTLTNGANNDVGIYTLYVSKDDKNSVSPTYYAIMSYGESGGSAFDSPAEATTAINNNDIQRADGILAELELAQLGYAIVQQDGGVGTISKIIVAKSTLQQAFVSGNSSVASGISTSTTNFNNLLSGSDTTVQAALETLDDHVHRDKVAVTVTAVGITLDPAVHDFVEVTGTTNITLPAAAGNTGKKFTILNAGAGVVTIVGTVSGVVDPTLDEAYQTIEVISTGTDWRQI